MLSTLVFILVLSVLVVVHEFGHFWAAKCVGIRVERFSIGFGPVLLAKRLGDTEFCFSALPFGGFVKLAGESAEEASGAAWEFQSKPALQKLVVVLAGPLMNAALAYVLFVAIFLVGQPTLTNRIGSVLENTPASRAGIRPDDTILAVDGAAVRNWEELLVRVQNSRAEVVFSIERGAERLDLTLEPRFEERQDLFGRKRRLAFVGVAPSGEIVYERSGLLRSFGLAAEKLWTMTSMIFRSLGYMATGQVSFKDSMTGPVGIFFMTKQAAQLGWTYLLYFVGSLSVSLFVLNLLPIPVLDGGHVLFIALEKLKGSPLKDSTKERMTQGGLAALLLLMGFVILQDLQRFSVLENLRNLVFRK